MHERRERAARNEALFRDVNERLEDLNRAFAAVTESFGIVCECDRADCIEQIEVATAKYEQVRSDPTTFLVAVGHEDPSAETVVERTESYLVVRKNPGAPARLAIDTDPRR